MKQPYSKIETTQKSKIELTQQTPNTLLDAGYMNDIVVSKNLEWKGNIINKNLVPQGKNSIQT